MKVYDRAYFDHWYRKKRIRQSRAVLARKIALAVALAEHALGRTLRSVLDVGCGEMPWREELRLVRPRARWQGVDPSDYVVSQFGKSHKVCRGSWGELSRLRLGRPFDLVVCCDVLHYLDENEIRSGLATLEDLLGGVAYLEAFTAEDDPTGDLEGFHVRPASFYRRLFRAYGLVPCGPSAWMLEETRENAAALDRLEPERERVVSISLHPRRRKSSPS